MSCKPLCPLCLCGFERDQDRRGSAGREAAGLLDVAPGLFERLCFGVLTRRALGAREARAGVDVVDRAVEDVAELVRLDLDRPVAERLAALRVAFGLHVRASPPARRRGCPTPSTSRRSSSRSGTRAGASPRT